MRRLLLVLIVLLPFAAMGGRAAAQSWPLEPAETATPQATIASLIGGVEAAVALQQANPGSAQWRHKLQQLPQEVLDLAGVPPEFVEEVGVETVMLVYETLTRLPPPPGPDQPGGAVADGATAWEIPHTPIALIRLTSGPREGAWLFDKRALTEARGWYARVKDLPKLPGHAPIDLVDAYRIAVGPLLGAVLPRGIVFWMPAWGRIDLLGVASWKWIAVLFLHGLILVLIALAARPVLRLDNLDGRLRQGGAGVILMLAASFLQFFTTQELLIGGPVARAFLVFWIVLFYIGAVLLAIASVRAIGELIGRVGGFDERPTARHVLLLGTQLATIAAAVWLIVVAMQLLGVPVAGIITGLGVGGIAVALAAQSTLGNLLGGVTMLLDGSVKVGDSIRFGSTAGTLEAIGLRSTRIRSSDRTLINVPNSTFASSLVENLGKRDRMLLEMTLGLRQETTPDQLRWFLARLRALLIAHPRVDEDNAQIRFTGFGDSSLDIHVQAYVPTRDGNEFAAVREDLLLRIMDLVERAGTGFAYPSQTLYVGRDAPPDPARTAEIEREVQGWRDRDNLPFPDFDAGQKGEMVNTLPWPPEGSALRRNGQT